MWRLGDDDALLGVVTSANVACGFHAGDPATMRRVCARAAAAGVAVGAQVSYRDLAGFGRRFMDVDPAELTDDILYQLAALDGIARVAGTRVTYVKPHGALYNAAVTHAGHAQAVVDAVLAYDRRLPVLGLPGSALLREAEAAGMHPVRGGLRRPRLHPAGTLVPRTQPGALVHDPATVAERAVRMAARRRRRRGGRHGTADAGPSRCACTATPRVRWRWRERCGRRWSPRAWTSPRSPAEQSCRDMPGLPSQRRSKPRSPKKSNGSVSSPLTMTSKCRWQPVESPALPTRATCCPPATCWPTTTSRPSFSMCP